MKNYLKYKKKTIVILLSIVILGGFLRFYGLNWDQNHHLHPDERFLTMVVQVLKWPESVTDYLNPKISSLNPYNVEYDFFVYGTFPLTLVKFFSQLISFEQYNFHNVALVGRLISGIFDLGVLFLVFLIGRKIFNTRIGYFAGFFYAASVLPIQLSHFFAVDTFLTFFLVLCFYFLILLPEKKYSYPASTFLGVSFGLAISSKISALLILPIILLVFLFYTLRYRSWLTSINTFIIFFITSYISLRIADPRLFVSGNFLNLQINNQFIENLRQLRSFSNPESLFPPAIQWINRKAIIFPLRNMLYWGLGLPLGVISLSGLGYSLYLMLSRIKSIKNIPNKFLNKLDSKNFFHYLFVFWIIFLFVYQGVQFSMTIRYFYPIYPFLSVIAAHFYVKVIFKNFKNRILHICFLILILIYPLSFIAIYSRLHSRVTASEWIYKNIPPGSIISCEHWDDCLPLPINGKSHNLYKIETLNLYDPDTAGKWEKLNQQLEKVDFIILSSNRLWGSIPRVPGKYPVTSKFYQDLFSEKLRFTKAAEIVSYPTIPFLGIELVDDNADESFTVYDHPKVIIYNRKQ